MMDTELTAELPKAALAPGRIRRRPRRRTLFLAGGAICVVAAAVVAIDPFSSGSGSHKASLATTGATATVTKRPLTSQTQVNATLGYAGSYSVTGQSGTASGSGGGQGSGGSQPPNIVTALPVIGQVISQGQVLYSVNGQPVVLLYGSTPAYRSLSEGDTGTDVTQLNADLVALGDATSSQLDPTSDTFSAATAAAVDNLQANLGVTQSGSLTLGQVVFVPTAARVTSLSASVGAPLSYGAQVLQATSTTRQVQVALDASQQTDVAVGDTVSITLPNNETTPGVVSSVGTVATCPSSSGTGGSSTGSAAAGTDTCSSGSSGTTGTPTITVDVTPSDPAATGTWDQAPVQVTITTASVPSALVVPVTALLAQSGGGYAVEVVGAGGVNHLVPVTLGLFDDADGLVQVTGSGLAAGQKVVVPAT